MWKELYIDKTSAPREPAGWQFLPWVLEQLVDAYDERRTKDAWEDFSNRLAKDVSIINEQRPTRRNLSACVGLLDIPFDQAQSLDEAALETRQFLVDDFNEAMFLVGREAEAGHILTGARAKSGGPLVELDKGVWGIDDFWPRLSQSAMDINSPYDFEATPTHWIFVEDNSMGWMIDNERISLGLHPQYHRRLAPKDEQHSLAFPGIEEARKHRERWWMLRKGLPIDNSETVRIDNLQFAAVSSGAPGRPTSMNIIFALLEKRIEKGEIAESQLAEATVLSLALDDINKDRTAKGLEPHPSILPKSIRPAIASRYKDAKMQMSGGAKTGA